VISRLGRREKRDRIPFCPQPKSIRGEVDSKQRKLPEKILQAISAAHGDI
jgi:hypothetical protein